MSDKQSESLYVDRQFGDFSLSILNKKQTSDDKTTMRELINTNFDAYLKGFKRNYREFKHNHRFSSQTKEQEIAQVSFLCTKELIEQVGLDYFNSEYKVPAETLNLDFSSIPPKMEQLQVLLSTVDDKIILTNRNSKTISDYLERNAFIEAEIDSNIAKIQKIKTHKAVLKAKLVENAKGIIKSQTKLENLKKIREILGSNDTLLEISRLIEILSKNSKKIGTLMSILNKGNLIENNISTVSKTIPSIK